MTTPGSLRRAARQALRRAAPALRIVAEDVLAESTRIDLLAVGAFGELVSVRIARDADEHATAARMAEIDLPTIVAEVRWGRKSDDGYLHGFQFLNLK